jgi:hypothetical protein
MSDHVPAFIARADLAEIFKVAPASITHRVRQGKLPPYDSTICRSLGWCSTTLAEFDPGLYKIIALHYAQQSK